MSPIHWCPNWNCWPVEAPIVVRTVEGVGGDSTYSDKECDEYEAHGGEL